MSIKRQIIDLRSPSASNTNGSSSTVKRRAAGGRDAEKRSTGSNDSSDNRQARSSSDDNRSKDRRPSRGRNRSDGNRSSAPRTPQQRPAAQSAPPAPRKTPRRGTAIASQTDVSFSELDLIEPLQEAVRDAGYTHPTPIQAQAIPPLLEGRDLLGIAQTGTGKTAAFTLPVIQHLATHNVRRRSKCARALVLTPTRELAIQIGESFSDYGRHLRLKHTVIFGGVNQKPQVRTMSSGVDILVATPGRLLDLIGQGFIDLSQVEFFVLDEADRMLDMGFIHDVKKVVAKVPKDRQTLLFSATMPNTIVSLAKTMMRDYERVEVTPAATTVERITQSVMFVEQTDKKELLADIFSDNSVARAIVFSRTKRGANRVSEFLDKIGVSSAPIHGNKSQNARQRALSAFQNGQIRALVATDIAARGIDVDDITHVINFDLPNEPDSYVHRIGRTARAGCDGVALSFCSSDELDYLRDIQKTIRQTVPVEHDQPFHAEHIKVDFNNGVRGSVKQGGNRRGGGGGGRRGGGGGNRSGGGGGRRGGYGGRRR